MRRQATGVAFVVAGCSKPGIGIARNAAKPRVSGVVSSTIPKRCSCAPNVLLRKVNEQ